jgi:3-hydroxyisobutyrate dehydrogenase
MQYGFINRSKIQVNEAIKRIFISNILENTAKITVENIDYSLADLEQDCWSRLVNGAIKSRSPFHTPAVATLAKGEISMRTVVLRKTIPETREIRFHTDIRSRKWEELHVKPSIGVLFYDASSRIQLRVKGNAHLHVGDLIANEAWQKTSLSSRRCYLTDQSPSSFSAIPTSGLSEEIEQENFSLAASEVGFRYFGVVSVHVQSIDWLWLHHAGHRRAFFDYEENAFQWMIP